MDYITKRISAADMHIVKELWEKLNGLHYENSRNFKRHYAEQTFERRCEKFARLPEENVRIDVALDGGGQPIGYCICSVEQGRGELDSLYVRPEYRNQSLGSRLARRGVDWLKSRRCGEIRVSVADGNESVFPFYESLGFRVRSTALELPQD
jgi:ribosomal protein S18 acetylase RimI-like enzyme